MMMETLSSRIKSARLDAGFANVRAAVNAFGWTYSTYAEYENGRSAPSRSALVRIGKAYRVSVDWLLTGRGPRRSGVAQHPDQVSDMMMLEIVGDVAVGVWRDEISEGREDRETYPVPIDPSFPAGSQYLRRVRGPSINRRAEDGSLVRCLKIEDAPRAPRPGDWVIVRQMRDGAAETTVKEYRETKGGAVELWPSSTDQRHQSPIRITPGKADEVSIIAFVIDFITPATRF